MTTWDSLNALLPPNLPVDVLDAIRRETAPARHRARVDAAKAAAFRAVLDSGVVRDSAPDASRVRAVIAGAWCHLEADGLTQTGGPLRLGTARAAWASGLGSGRRLAGDGDAWTAAIRAAGEELIRCTYPSWGWVAWDPDFGDCESGLAIASRDADCAIRIPSPPDEVGALQHARRWGHEVLRRIGAQPVTGSWAA